ncbi:magnesium transporter CorA [Sphingomonas sp. Leaf208]|uniref:zinc transporter ZntB n=1 Tax=Sphingomonas sp. Leaf208 TaxID=1735679 RepID=UPI0006F94759|nr:zinc transporter ZntB [Sphingomonas sp. Leaf208]KQM53298.1 magnesium transporter CorA [Sphingomonas sp. Leaf208]
MSGFAFRIVDGKATRVDVKEALTCTADLVWVHLSTTAEHAQAWLRDEAKLLDYVIDALTATETRPRCEAVGDGAFLNLRGRSKEELDTSDLLASVRIWAVKGRVFSVTRKPLIAVAEVEKMVERHEVRDPGDLIAAFATAITTDLDPDVATLGDELDDCEEQLDANRVFELRRAVSKVRVAAIGYKRFLSPQRAALEKLAALPGDWLADDDRLHLAAAADRAARMAEELEAIRERSALVHETLTDLRAEQIDNRSLIISIAAMVFLPLTFLTGLYGMNVKGLPYAEEPWAFDAIAGACVLIAVGVVAYFSMRHWFKR